MTPAEDIIKTIEKYPEPSNFVLVLYDADGDIIITKANMYLPKFLRKGLEEVGKALH